MDRRLRRALTVGRAVVHEVRTERVTFTAGSITYHAFVSLLPLLLLVWRSSPRWTVRASNAGSSRWRRRCSRQVPGPFS